MADMPAVIGVDAPRETLRQDIAAAYRRDETAAVEALLRAA